MDTTQIREITVRYGKRRSMPQTIQHSGDAVAFLRRAIGSSLQEQFIAIAVDAKNRPIAWYTVGLGGSTHCPVDLGAVFRGAIACGATGVLVAHNHPSGDSTPSQPDIDVTRRLTDAGAVLDLRILDHIVIGEAGAWTSLRDARLWPN